MLRSMTGFARAEAVNGNRKCVTEIRTLNHRFMDVNIRMPARDYSIDKRIKELVAKKITRGYVELSITISDTENSKRKLEPDEDMIRQYIAAADKIKESYPVSGDIDISTILALKDIFKYVENDTDAAERWELIGKALETALNSLLEMRGAEGEALKKDLLEKLGDIEKSLKAIMEVRKKQGKEAVNKIKTKIEEMLGDFEADPQRVLTEAALLAERSDIEEESIRLGCHIDQLRKLVNKGGPVGRKIEFILQEMNREANTIGSKSNIYDISSHVVEIKSVVEKIREQAANIE